MVRTEGRRKALVGDVRVDRGRQLAVLLNELGYEAEIAGSGRETFSLAATSPDFDLIVLDPTILQYDLSQTIANLRADARTAGIPVLVAGSLQWEPRLDSYERRYSRVRFMVRPATSDDLRAQVEPILDDLGTDPLTSAERAEYARRAIIWLVRLARGELEVFNSIAAEDAFVQAVSVPELAHDAVLGLGLMPTRSSQRTLADTLLDESLPVDLRRLAAEQVCHSIQKFGLLLTREQIDALGRLHDQAADPEIHSAVAAVVGCMVPDAAQAGHRLRMFRPQFPEVPSRPRLPQPPATQPTPGAGAGLSRAAGEWRTAS
jgi:CheY-like chemotaxis protein